MHPAERVDIRILPLPALTAKDWDEIWELTQIYVETNRSYYEAKLRAFPEVALFRNRSGALVGIAAIDVYSSDFRSETSTIIFTSSVVIDEPYRRHNLIQRTGFRVFLRAGLRHPFRPIYWFFDTFSYKSYGLLPRNFVEYWPRYDRPTPQRQAALIDHLAHKRYGTDWRPGQGIVGRSGQKKLKPTTAAIEPKLLADPNIQFFVTTNPGHQEGDMLVCLCPLNLKNWLHAAGRAIRRRFQSRQAPLS
jgi:hypothetical protein